MWRTAPRWTPWWRQSSVSSDRSICWSTMPATFGDRPIWEVDPDEWWRTWEVNVRGTMLCARAVLLGMVARRRGRDHLTSPWHFLAQAERFGLPRLEDGHHAPDRNIWQLIAEYGVSIFAITPGLVNTPLARETFDAQPPGSSGPASIAMSTTSDRCSPELLPSVVWPWRIRPSDLSGCYIELADDLDDARRADEIEAELSLRIPGPRQPRQRRHELSRTLTLPTRRLT